MRRRELIAALGGVLILPWTARAQQAGVRRVGIFFAQWTIGAMPEMTGISKEIAARLFRRMLI